MNKIQFLLELDKALSRLPAVEKEERLRFYSEIIEDRTEEGLTEEEAVAAVGTVRDIAEQITAECPVETAEKPKDGTMIYEESFDKGEYALVQKSNVPLFIIESSSNFESINKFSSLKVNQFLLHDELSWMKIGKYNKLNRFYKKDI